MLTGEGIAALKEEGAASQRKQHKFQQQLDSYEQMLSSVITSLELTNSELKVMMDNDEKELSNYLPSPSPVTTFINRRAI